jgi:general secretion pathway protein G
MVNLGRARPRRERMCGFTLLELLVVVAIIGILSAIALPRLIVGPKRAKEAVLLTNLHTLREVLDQYYADKQRCAESLEVLVDEGYLRDIPIDPMTGSKDWTTEPCEGEDADLSALTSELDGFGGGPGIWDVHSSHDGAGLNGSNFSDW